MAIEHSPNPALPPSEKRGDIAGTAIQSKRTLKDRLRWSSLKNTGLSAGEHALWYAASIGSGAGFLKIAENTHLLEQTQTPVASTLAYGAMLGILGLVGEGTIRQQMNKWSSGSLYTHLGFEAGIASVKKDLKNGKNGENPVSCEQATEIINEVKQELKSHIGRRKTDSFEQVIPQEALHPQTQKRMDKIVKWTRRSYVLGQFAEEAPVLAAGLASTHDWRSLSVFLGGTAIPTIAIRGTQYLKNRKYEGDEPIFFKRTRKRLRQAADILSK